MTARDRRQTTPLRAAAITVVALTLLCGASAQGGPIQDNSFLLEEAYNQEPGVVQHISTFTRFHESEDWSYTFTQEWPVPGVAHQLSFTLPYVRSAASDDGGRGIGDILLNYRYQLVGDGEARIAVAPRLSLSLPTGDSEQQRGAGALGVQVNLPVSVVLTEKFVTHWNLGASYTRRAENSAGDQANTSSWNFGQSLVWLTRPNFNVLVELAYTAGESVVADGRKDRFSTLYLSPGVRWAHNLSGDLQIVPGVAFPLGIDSSNGERAVFLYLSFEHPLWKPR